MRLQDQLAKLRPVRQRQPFARQLALTGVGRSPIVDQPHAPGLVRDSEESTTEHLAAHRVPGNIGFVDEDGHASTQQTLRELHLLIELNSMTGFNPLRRNQLRFQLNLLQISENGGSLGTHHFTTPDMPGVSRQRDLLWDHLQRHRRGGPTCLQPPPSFAVAAAGAQDKLIQRRSAASRSGANFAA